MSLVNSNLRWSGLMISYIFLSSNLPIQSQNFRKMADLAPSLVVRGMKQLDRNLFAKTVRVPCLKVKSESVRPLTDVMRKYLLKLRSFKPIRPVVASESVANDTNHMTDGTREVFLNPKIVSSFSDISEHDQKRLGELGVDESCLKVCPLQLTYDNWTADDVLGAVLPEGMDIAAGYSLVGHIVHLNLRDHLLAYKQVIGEVLLDKIKQARTVVNKVDTIDNTFRVFNMEVLSGKPEFVTEVKENSFRFKFDFSAVYWNPRLCTEHERIVEKLNAGNVLYDVFAGVGPFSVPAAKKKCTVLANDLNPESYKWLQHNAKLNKVDNFITTFNKDGADFIKDDVKKHILKQGGKSRSHIVMNLPDIAATFLKSFKQLFSVEELTHIKSLPLAHVYCFVKGEGDSKEMAKNIVENELNCSISDSVDEIFFVRNVAPNKNMMRVSFQITDNIVLGGKRKFESRSEDKELKKCK